MNKLTLNVDELQVDSFEIPSSVREKGTVKGHWGWSDDSICPTTAPSDCKKCY